MENQFTSRIEDFQIVQLLEKYLKNWPWFVLSVILCLGLAFLYLKSTPKQYKRAAAVLIKDDYQQDITAAFSGNSYLINTNVSNELEAFKSPQLAQEVVRRLKLNISYVTKEGLRNIDLYTQSPIIAVFSDSHESEAFAFKVELLPDSVIVLSNFYQNNSKIQQSVKTRFNKETATPVGAVMISPSLYYSPDMSYRPINVSKNEINSLALKFAKAVVVSLSSKENTVVVLEMEDVSIQRAEDYLNTLINVYRENWVVEKNKGTISTLAFLNERIAITEQELTEIDSKLELYKRRNLVTDVRNAASMQMSQSLEYSGRIQEIRNQVSIAQSIQEYLNDNTKVSELLPNTTGVNNSALETSISQYNTLLTDRNRLSANSSELNPIIIERTKSLQSLRQSIINTVDNLVASLSVQLSGLQAQEARMTSNIASNPGQERHLISIDREQKIKESLYAYLLQQREENEMALVVSATNLRVINPPVGDMIPVKPNKIKILLIVLIVGLGIPCGIILGYDFINVTIRDKKDLADLPAPLLGIIPKVHIEAENKMLMVQDHGRGAINEAFRILRTNFKFACPKDTKVIQITSLDPNAGKTFIALNLAMSFAVAGKKIALIDMDLRMASLSNLIGNPEKGTTYMLNGKTYDKAIIKKDYFYPGFDIIPAGLVPPNPSELLMNDELAKLIEKLKVSYDYIFIDSTPIQPVADAIIVAQHADLSIFVVREQITDRRKLPELKNVFYGEKFKNMRLVLNGSVTETMSNKYNAYYSLKN